ncbi:hypothetical protein RF11_14824 [Thelohanellus kitauei]|uniref:Uncharacterized protein n=1 Tax=Thelohanellus kitauei TaxID=669202 RepID=A0A0C2MXA9_THEKT|nr:hypothetical protein RF11_14824 [Thelohanellus kitauei]
MLGKPNVLAAILKCEIHILCERHCMLIEKTYLLNMIGKKIPIMIEIETILPTVYTMFRRSSVNNRKFQELRKAAERKIITFRLVNEVICLYRHLAVTISVRNYKRVINYFTDELSQRNIQISK